MGFAPLNALQRALQNRQRSKGIEKSKIIVGIVKKQYEKVNHGRANAVPRWVWLFAVSWKVTQSGEVD